MRIRIQQFFVFIGFHKVEWSKEYCAVVNKEELSGQQDKNFMRLLLETTSNVNRVIVANATELIGFVDAEDEWTEEKYIRWHHNR